MTTTPRNYIHRLQGAVLALLALISLIACGGPDQPQVAYQPDAYGQQVALQPGQTYQQATPTGLQTVTVAQPQNSWICWLADDYHEAALLAASGACPQAWVPILMASMTQGLLWHQMYSPYYDSYGYYGRYVPSAYRNTYVSHVTVFETRYKTEIIKQESSSSAKWKGSDGKPYNGQAVSKYVSSGQASFGSGSVRSAGFASSATRAAAASSNTSSSKPGGTSSSGSSKGFGGGGGRSAPGTSFGGLSSGSSSRSGGSFGGGSGRR